MKLKEKIYNLFRILKKSVEKFPLTIIGVLVLTVVYTICLDNSYLSNETLEKITEFVVIFSSGAFLIETLIRDEIKKRIVYYILSGVIAAIFTFALNMENGILGMSNDIFLFRIIRILVCYLISVVVLGIYYNYKKSGKSFEQYITNTSVNIFKTTLIYGIFAVGIAIVTSIFIYLILDGLGYTLIARMELLLFGIYYVPTIIYSFYNQEEETGKFAKVVIKYVLGTLVLAAFAIIYMYIIKIIALRDMPSNQIFRILSSLFIIGLPIWTMCFSFKEETAFNKIMRKLPLLFIPFIILQIYSIGTRIQANGITEPRYLCVMLIIFEIIYTIIYLKNKEKIGNILLVFIILTAISSIVPVVNMFNISNLSQYQNLKICKQKREYTDEEKVKINGAYNYLRYSVEGKKYIDEYLTEEDKDIILELRKSNKTQDNKKIINASKDIEYIDVSGYNKLYNIDSYEYKQYDKQSETIDEKFSTLSFDIRGSSDKKIQINVLPLVKEYINHAVSIDKYFEEKNELEIDENKKVILKNITIQYNEETNLVSYYNMSGYYLEKIP